MRAHEGDAGRRAFSSAAWAGVRMEGSIPQLGRLGKKKGRGANTPALVQLKLKPYFGASGAGAGAASAGAAALAFFDL